MILQFGREYDFLSFCPYCFPDLARKDASGRAAMPEAARAAVPEEGRAAMPEEGLPAEAPSEPGA